MTKNEMHNATDNLINAVENIIDMTEYMRINTHLTACRALLIVTQIRNGITPPGVETRKARQLEASAEGMINDAADMQMTPLDDAERSDLVDLIDVISVASDCAWRLYAAAISSGDTFIAEHAHIIATDIGEQAYCLIEHIRDARAVEIADLEGTLLATRDAQAVIDAMIPAPGSEKRMREMMASGIKNPFSVLPPRVSWGDDEPSSDDDGWGRAIIANGRVLVANNSILEPMDY